MIKTSKTIKRTILGGVICGFALFGNPTEASTQRLSISDVYSTFTEFTKAYNTPNISQSMYFLNKFIAGNTQFSYTVNSDIQNSSNRYPFTSDYFQQASMQRNMTKSQKIRAIANKNMAINGYRTEFRVLNIAFNPDQKMAVVDLEQTEQSIRYNPQNQLQELIYGKNITHAHSRCRASLLKHNGEVHLTAMNCATVMGNIL